MRLELAVLFDDVAPGSEGQDDGASFGIDRLPHRPIVPGDSRGVDPLFRPRLNRTRLCSAIGHCRAGKTASTHTERTHERP